MYLFLKGLHNVVRWVVVLGGVAAVVVVLRGLFSRATWGETERRVGLVFSSALNLQFLIGILLFVVSPIVRTGLRDMGAAMGNDQMRFFTVEHTLLMLLAAVAAQLGYSLSRRAGSDRARFVRASIGYVLAVVLLAVGIPWWRPLLPGL